MPISTTAAPPLFSGWLGYGTAMSNGVLVEPTDSGYNRIPISLGSLNPAQPSANLGGGYIGPAVNSWGTIGYAALFDAATIGNLIAWWPLENGFIVNANGSHTLISGDLKIALNEAGQTGASAGFSFPANTIIGHVGAAQPLTSGVSETFVSGTVAASTPIVPKQTLRDSLWQTCIPFWGQAHSTTASGGTLYTYGANFTLEGQFTAIQLIVANTGGSAMTIGGVCVAAPATRQAGSLVVTPQDGNGNTLAWTQVTFSGSATPTIPAATVNGTTNGQPSLLLSDVIPLSSLPRTDGGLGSLLYTRLLTPASGAYDTPAGMVQATLTQYGASSNGRFMDAYVGTADFVSTPTNQAGLTDGNAFKSGRFCFVVGVRYLSTTRTVTLMGVGDSLTTGYQTLSGYNGFGLQAAVKISNPGILGVQYCAHGFTGSMVYDFVSNAKTLLALAPPQIVTVAIDSPNDYTGVTTGKSALQTLQQSQAMSFIDYAIGLGIQVIAVSPIPFGGGFDLASNYGLQRLATGNMVRSLTARGVSVLDAQSIISGYVPTTANLQTLPANLIAPDGLHLTDAGQALIGNALAGIVAPMLA